jgi:hypothetical protein
VHDVVDCAIEEDAQAIAVSSYQGGHVEYFTYMRTLLEERGAAHIHVFGGGGGVIVPAVIAALAKKYVRIFSPDDGRRQGLVGMIREILTVADHPAGTFLTTLPDGPLIGDRALLARAITTLEHEEDGAFVDVVRARQQRLPTCPVLGITGTGGAGKSSLIDELLLRFLEVFPEKTIAVLDAGQLLFHYGLLPRIAVSIAAGALLGLSGTLFGQILQNPLAEPSTLGTFSGAAVALVAATLYAPWLLDIGRFWIACAGA